MKKYKAVIVGCGRIASLFANEKKRKGVVTHAQAYLSHPRIELAAACDLDEKRLSEFGERWGVRRLYKDFDDMMRAEKPDLLSICTWNTSHAPLALRAVQYGVKGILCEKPIADSLKNAATMIEAAKKKRVPLLVNYFRRYNPLHRKLKKMIEDGALGDIQSISCYYTAGIMNTGTHLFDTLMYFFGDIAWVWADKGTKPLASDPTVDGHLFFKKGFGCSLTGLDVKQYLQFEIDIYGSKKRLRLSDVGLKAEFWDVVDHPMLSGYKTLRPGKTLSTDFSRDLWNTVDNLTSCVSGDASPLCSGEDAKKSLETALAISLSLKSGKKVTLPLKNNRIQLESR